MRRGKIRITAELLGYMIFGKEVNDMNIVKNEDCRIFDVYFSDGSLDEIDEGKECPLYILDQLKDLENTRSLRRVG